MQGERTSVSAAPWAGLWLGSSLSLVRPDMSEISDISIWLATLSTRGPCRTGKSVGRRIFRAPRSGSALRRLPRHGRRRLSARVTHRGSLALQPSPDDAVDSALARAGAAGAGDLRPGGSSGRPAVAEGRRRDPQGAVQESVGNPQSILEDGMKLICRPRLQILRPPPDNCAYDATAPRRRSG